MPGVIQFESKRCSLGSVSPRRNTAFSCSSASLAERNLWNTKWQINLTSIDDLEKYNQNMVLKLYLLPLCWFIFARGATPSTAKKNNFCGLMIRNRTYDRKRINPPPMIWSIEAWWSYLDVMEDIFEYFFFGDAKVGIEIIRMWTIVNDSVHVQV